MSPPTGNLATAFGVPNGIAVQYCEVIPWVGGCHGIVLHQGSCPSRRAQLIAHHETTSSSVLRAREVEEAWIAPKRHERQHPAQSGRQGGGNGIKWP